MSDLYIQIEHHMTDHKQNHIFTNVKQDQLESLLADFLYTQMGAGADDSKPNEEDLYRILITLDLSYDTFRIKSNCGNKGLETGIILWTTRNLEKFKINPPNVQPQRIP